MRARTTLILAVLAVLVAAGALWLERARVAREAAEAAERRVVNFHPDTVSEIVVETAGERVVARIEGERWRLVAPVEAPADGPTVEGLLAFVRRLEKVRALGAAADLAAYGLDAPAVRLRLSLRDGQRLALALAGPNPTGTGVYAALEGTPVVFLAPRELARELAKSPYLDELRDKTILPLDPERVRRLEVERAGVRIVIARVAERRWRVERPFAAPGDDGIIRDFLWKLGASRAHAVIRDPGPLRRYGLDRPHARVWLGDDAGGVRTMTVVADERDPARVYVAADGAPAVHVTDGQLLADLAIAPEAFRDRQLLVFDPREVERITIRYPGDTLVLERASEGWRMTRPVEGEAVRATVENILEVLPNLRYTAVESRPAPDLDRYGLARPRLAVTVGLRGGRELPTLAVGREEGGAYFVMVGGAAPVYMVDARLIRVIPEDSTDAKRYPLPERLKRGWQKLEQGKS